MFSFDKRKVDMSGGAKAASRRELLETSRLQRAAREKQKQRESAALAIQAFYRGRTDFRRARTQAREAHRAVLDPLTEGKPSPLPAVQLVSLLRQFLFYYSPKVDTLRLLKLAKLLAVSLATDDGYHSYLFHGSSESVGVWQAQMRRLCFHLSRLLDETRSSEGVGAIAFALWLCLDAKSWPWLKKETSAQVGQTINESQMDVFMYLANHGLYPRLGTTLHRLTVGLLPPVHVSLHVPSSNSSSSSSSSSTTVSLSASKHFSLSATDKITIARLVALALRPSSVPPATSSSSASSSSAALSSLSVSPAPSPTSFSSSSSSSFQESKASKRHKTGSDELDSEDNVWVLVASHIFSIPLLAARFASGGLSSITQTLLKPTIFNKCCKAVVRRSASLPQGLRSWEGLEPPSHNSSYLLGNLLELGLDSTPATNYMDYLNALRIVLLSLPPEALPQDGEFSASSMHPLVREQLLLFRRRPVLESLARRLEDSVQQQKMQDANTVTILLDTLLHKWSSDASNTDILNTLVFSTQIVTVLWKSLVSMGVLEMFRGGLLRESGQDARTMGQITEMVSMFCLCYAHQLFILDDQEFFVKEHPFPLAEVGRMVEFFKLLLLQYYWKDTASVSATSAVTTTRPNTSVEADDSDDDDAGVEMKRAPKMAPSQMQACLTRVFLNLRDRYARKAFCPAHVWLMQIPMAVFHDELARGNDRAVLLLRNIPFVLPFDERVRIFYENIARDQDDWREGGLEFDLGRGVHAVIRRNNILTDGFEKLYHLGSRLKGRVQITFIDEHGNQEAGIDGGGLFKEFLTVLLKAALHPDLGLFRSTADNSLCPNPDSALVLDRREHLAIFQFLGRIVGKALYDGIQIEPQFANFFLRECLGRKNTVDELVCLDPELHRHLMFLKTYEGDIEELGLNFCVSKNTFGETTEVELIPNGANVPVTRDNRLQFVMYMADYRLNKETKEQSRAFVAGMHDIINLEWLRMFSSDELSLLISGAPHIDLIDLRQNTNYSNGYSDSHELVKWFWEVLESFDAPTQAGFLRFSTSCSRAPLLGFKSLYPKFCIQRVNADANEATLPTSATCMNLFRLPRYSSKAQLKAKLLYAINSGTGFGLT